MAKIATDNTAKYMQSILHNGDCMNQREFHGLYEKMPEGFRAELIQGICYVSEPVSQPHSDHDFDLIGLASVYETYTQGIRGGTNATVILGEEDEVQPDVILRISPEFNGQSGNAYEGKYISGAPELVGEIAYSSRAIDLHAKKRRYQLAGVIEYIVVCLKPLELRWFDLKLSKLLKPGKNGVIRSSVLPGFWIHEQALLTRDKTLSLEVLHKGLESREHQKFLKKLAAARK
ncbi:MAG TPA: Uma2 family endonuclease [Candidatus Obscuribacterales bacterium]